MKVIVFYRHLRSELEQTVIACLAGRNAQELSYSRFVQTPSGESRRFLSDICNADPQEHLLQYLRSCTRACSTKSYTALNELLNGCKERAEVLVGYSRIKLATVFFGGGPLYFMRHDQRFCVFTRNSIIIVCRLC